MKVVQRVVYVDKFMFCVFRQLPIVGEFIILHPVTIVQGGER
jgi:hypothetical protein